MVNQENQEDRNMAEKAQTQLMHMYTNDTFIIHLNIMTSHPYHNSMIVQVYFKLIIISNRSVDVDVA